MSTDVTSSAAFLAEAAGLAARLLEQGRSVFDVRYDGLGFGSWVLTAGTRKRRVCVTWDGRESTLRFQGAEFSDSQSRPTWRVLSDAPVLNPSPHAVLRAAEAVILAQSGAPSAQS